MKTKEKQAYLLGYMKCVNETMSLEHPEISPSMMAQFSSHMLVELSKDLEIPIPPSDMTESAILLYHDMGRILDLWRLK